MGVKESNKETEPKKITVLTSNTIRYLVKTVNDIGIKKEDIVSLLKDDGQFILVYFK